MNDALDDVRVRCATHQSCGGLLSVLVAITLGSAGTAYGQRDAGVGEQAVSRRASASEVEIVIDDLQREREQIAFDSTELQRAIDELELAATQASRVVPYDSSERDRLVQELEREASRGQAATRSAQLTANAYATVRSALDQLVQRVESRRAQEIVRQTLHDWEQSRAVQDFRSAASCDVADATSCVASLLDVFTQATRSAASFGEMLGAQRTVLVQRLSALRERRADITRQLADAREGQGERYQTEFLITAVGLPAFVLLAIIILVAPFVYRNHPDVMHSLFTHNVVLDIFTVSVLTTTIMILGLSQKLSTDQLGTLLAGVSGYVLGRASQRRTRGRAAPDLKRPPRDPRDSQAPRSTPGPSGTD